MTRKLKILSFTGLGIACTHALREIHKTLERIGHEVRVAEIDSIEDVAKRNIEIMDNTLVFEPDMILTIDIIGLILGHFFYEPPIRIVSLFFDNPNTHFSPGELMLTMNNYFVFSIDRDFARQPHNAHLYYTPWYYDPDFFRDLQLERKYDVSFIGHHNPHREALFLQLADRNPIHIWGDENWSSVVHRNIQYHGFADPREDTPRIYNQSRIVLSLNAEQFTDGISERLYNIMACGALAITNHMPVIAEHFRENEELVVFRDTTELSDKIQNLLRRPEQIRSMADRGRRKVATGFTCEHFLRSVIEKVMQTEIQITAYREAVDNFISHTTFACWDSYDFVGRLAYGKGMYDKACRHFSRAVEIDGTQGYSYLGQISSLLKTGNPDEAYRQYQKLCQIDDKKAELAEKLFHDNVNLHFEM